MHVISVSPQVIRSHFSPPISTLPHLAPKAVPVMVSTPPPRGVPEDGEIEVRVGVLLAS